MPNSDSPCVDVVAVETGPEAGRREVNCVVTAPTVPPPFGMVDADEWLVCVTPGRDVHRVVTALRPVFAVDPVWVFVS